MKEGIFGYWEFSTRKLMFGRYYITPIITYGEVIKADNEQIIIIDCDDIKYRIVWNRLIKFEKQDKPTNEIT